MPRKLDSCVRQVTQKGGARNPHAVCNASLDMDDDSDDDDERRQRQRATRGSRPFTDAEIRQGYRRL